MASYQSSDLIDNWFQNSKLVAKFKGLPFALYFKQKSHILALGSTV